jgi:hypothetical protein
MNAGPEAFVFSIHDLVKCRVRGPELLIAPVIHEFDYHRDLNPPHHDEDLDLDVRLDLLSSIKKEAGPDAMENSGKSFSWEGRHLLAKWRAGMSEAAGRPARLYFHGSRLSRFIVSKWIVEPALRVEAEKKGAVMVHAACISDGENAVLVAGPGGAGKTTWVLEWLAAGHPYMSDDFTLIKDENVLAYVTPLRLGARNILANKVLENMSGTDKARIFARTALRRALLGRAKFYFKAPIKRAVPGIEILDQAKIAGAVWLKHTESKPHQRKTGLIAPEKIAGLMTDADREEMHGFGQQSGPASTALLPDSFWTEHKQRLRSALSEKPCFSISAHSLPSKDAASSVKSLLEWIESG